MNISQTHPEKKKLTTINKYKPFSFFFKGLIDRFYYWESLILCRKFFICLISTLSESILDEIKWIMLIIIFFIFLIITWDYLPYTSKISNNLEILSLLTCLVSVFSCFTFNSNSPERFKTFLSALTLIFNACFFSYALIQLIFELYKFVRKIKGVSQQKLTILKKYLQKSKQKKSLL